MRLLKLVWHPDDVDGTQVKPTAFRKDDLDGSPGAHVSVDRHDKAERSTMETTASNQKAKANGGSVKRHEAMIGPMHCVDVRAITLDEDGSKPLQVVPRPIDGNSAHCGIVNVSGRDVYSRSSRSFLDEIRAKLAAIASPAATFDEAYGSR